MPIRTLSDFNAAFDDGRFHVQRVVKNLGVAHAGRWADSSFATGQPGFFPRIGDMGAFTPMVAVGNQAVFFPGIAPGHERYLVETQLRMNQNTFNGPASVIIYDLLGYYPSLDGDSEEVVELDNTESLPRYQDGVSVWPVMVNHIVPSAANGLMLMEYVDSDDVPRSVTVDVPMNGVGCACSGSRNTVGAVSSTLHIALQAGVKGVKRVTSVQFLTPPGGLFCVYLVRILGTVILGDNNVCAEKNFIERGLSTPRIYDGACIGFFDRLSVGTTNRQCTIFGNLTFAWG